MTICFADFDLDVDSSLERLDLKSRVFQYSRSGRSCFSRRYTGRSYIDRVTPDQWLNARTFHHSRYASLDKLAERKKALGCTVSVGIPTLNEQETIGAEVRTIREALLERFGLVDEIVVVDSGSTDRTRGEAVSNGAFFYSAADILPNEPPAKGKGENLWKSLYVMKGDLIVWLDADIKNIAPKFVYGLLGPLLEDEAIGYVKAFYNRPLRTGSQIRPSGGGRVTEILIRPLLSLCYPELAYIMQPLSGEYAGRRSVLENLPFSIGYGVEIGHLLDLYTRHGLSIFAQVDLDLRIHRNRTIQELGRMSFGILQTFLEKAKKQNRLSLLGELGSEMVQFQMAGEAHIPLRTAAQEFQRPPIATLESYREKRNFF